MTRGTVLFPFLMIGLFAALLACQGLTQKQRQAKGNAAKASEPESDKAGEITPAEKSLSDSPGPSPGRGRGRGLTNLVVGRGRARYHALSLSKAEIQSFEITTVRAVYRPVRSLHTAMGKVLAPQTRMAKVSYAFSARISAIHVKIGDWVNKGQPVLTVQSEEVGHAKSEYYKAIADLELARSNYEREKRLFSRGVGAQKNTLTTEAEFKVAQTNLDAAEKKLHVLGFSEAEVKVISETHQINPEIALFAPIGGKIIEHDAVLGSMVDQNSELLTIMDPTMLWVDAEIFERDIAKIRIGQNAQVAVPAYPGEAFTGKLSYISDLLNQETRTITVRTEVQNRGFKLKPGMFADVAISLNGAQKLLTLPAEALLDDQNEKIVFVKDGAQYSPRIVAAGTAQDGFCAISDGLREGEEVVVRGNFLLKSKLYDELLKKAHVH